MVKVTAFTLDRATGTITQPVAYEARDRQEAINWAKFNRDWMRGFKIDGQEFRP